MICFAAMTMSLSHRPGYVCELHADTCETPSASSTPGRTKHFPPAEACSGIRRLCRSSHQGLADAGAAFQMAAVIKEAWLNPHQAIPASLALAKPGSPQVCAFKLQTMAESVPARIVRGYAQALSAPSSAVHVAAAGP